MFENKIFYGRINAGKSKKGVMPIIEECINNKRNMILFDNKSEYQKEYTDQIKKRKL